MTTQVQTGDRPLRDVYTVSRLNLEAKTLLEASFPIIWIEGEISNLARPASGHLYFSLKDEQAQVRCALFRSQANKLGLRPENGMQVLVRARVSLYAGRGDFQLIAETLEDAGEGALRRAFDALKQKLSAAGLFDQSHKRPLPRLPKRIGLITSSSGAVLHDILTTLKRRFPAIPVLLYPVAVQGEGAAEQIAQALRLASQRQDCDALILARGGGSLEDLWPFNEEIVAHAIYESAIPVVVGVGHETDFTIADMVADARAPTPTAAAELLSPNQQELLQRLAQFQNHLQRQILDKLRDYGQRVDWYSSRLTQPQQYIERLYERNRILLQRLLSTQSTFMLRTMARFAKARAQLQQQSPMARLQERNIVNNHMRAKLHSSMLHYLERLKQRQQQAVSALNTLNPLATLERGYAIVQRADTSEIIREADSVEPGERLRAKLASGELHCIVESRLSSKKDK